MKKKFASTQAITDEFVVLAPQRAVREVIARQAGQLLEAAVLDGIDTSHPLLLSASHQYDRRLNVHVARVSLVVESLPVKQAALATGTPQLEAR